MSWIDAGPAPEAKGPSCWTIATIREWIKRCFDVDFTAEGVRRDAHRPGFRHVPPRPVHPWTNLEEQEDFRSNLSQLAKAGLPDGVSSEDVLVFFRNEARIGQKGVLSRVWA